MHGTTRGSVVIVSGMPLFDYTAPAELFASPTKGTPKFPMVYRRFASSALAIQFAIEEMPHEVRRGALLEVNEVRFDPMQILELYESSDYPLPRKPP